MSDSIKSRWVNKGDPCEAKWLSDEPSGEKGSFYWDEKQQKYVPGYPPQPEKFGQAPGLITDSMPACYHEAAGRVIESRSEWKQADAQHNTVTFGSVKDMQKDVRQGVKREKKEYQDDVKQARRKATQAYKENPQEVRAKVDARAREQEKQLKKMRLADNQKAELRKHGVDV